MLRNLGFLLCAHGALLVYACTPDFGALNAGSAGTGADANGGTTGEEGGSPNGANGGSGSASTAGKDSSAGKNSTAGKNGTAGTAGSEAMGGDENGGAPPSGGSTSGGSGGTTTGGTGGTGGTGEPTCVAAGEAFHFTSGSYINVPRSVQDDFTLEGWIKLPTSLSGSYFWQGSPFMWADSTESGTFDFGVSILSSHVILNIGTPDYGVIGTINVTTDKWEHIAITRVKSSGAVKLFVNGVLDVANVVPINKPLDAKAEIAIGWGPGQGTYFEGWMDELRVWSVARSQAQIAASMHQLLKGDETGLVAYYQLDKITSLAIADATGHGNDGTVQGGDAASALGTSNAPVCEEK